ncbi:hypothetical protein DFH08DRAFT_834751 [Mycena albidolilacea]|uniref:Uncharacterized protein n=1 Tax=Mycena albidolilacea TaxID=1033008 RepID=A0AAD7ARF3_9AGAR|nr:hypothetical protein DFH08DRAFT_834751 [Mycena albidolilacea]
MHMGDQTRCSSRYSTFLAFRFAKWDGRDIEPFEPCRQRQITFRLQSDALCVSPYYSLPAPHSCAVCCSYRINYPSGNQWNCVPISRFWSPPIVHDLTRARPCLGVGRNQHYSRRRFFRTRVYRSGKRCPDQVKPISSGSSAVFRNRGVASGGGKAGSCGAVHHFNLSKVEWPSTPSTYSASATILERRYVGPGAQNELFFSSTAHYGGAKRSKRGPR